MSASIHACNAVRKSIETDTTAMISDHFDASPALLRLFAGIQPGTPWERAISLIQVLQDKGFDTPKSEGEDSLLDAREAAEFTQTMRHNNEEVAMAYYARGRTGTLTMATLTWIAGVNLSSLQAVEAVKQVFLDLIGTLGPAHAVLDQTSAWVKDGEAGAGDEVAASACWSREKVAASGPTLDVKDYQAARRALKHSIDFHVVLEKSASKKWKVIGALVASS